MKMISEQEHTTAQMTLEEMGNVMSTQIKPGIIRLQEDNRGLRRALEAVVLAHEKIHGAGLNADRLDLLAIEVHIARKILDDLTRRGV